ncbi:MAG TPA: HAD family phosphatase [Candidatus Sulfotelmatobacter sp.]|jgi:putative hydrolase of the HAD superfamily|nr:HAD family phosphatase [Candidatus Sulfotelmatobacter sp.]
MPDVTALFWDVGGVILSNGWDRAARSVAAKKFGLDWEEFQDRHELASPAFETGQITLETYLQRTVFYRKRSFTPEEFVDFIFAQSSELPDSRAVVDEISKTGKYLLATINNEPRELNEYRIHRFNLRREFDGFFSSCYLGVRKPDEGIYKLALEVTQRSPEECLFIDDRELNLECARQMNMTTIHFQNAAQLRRDLVANGVNISQS